MNWLTFVPVGLALMFIVDRYIYAGAARVWARRIHDRDR